jgi:hypothetical protein
LAFKNRAMVAWSGTWLAETTPKATSSVQRRSMPVGSSMKRGRLSSLV